MKTLQWLPFIGICLYVNSALAQNTTSTSIEGQLLKLFKKIDYWRGKHSIDTTMAWADSLEKANNVFGERLKYYTSQYPSTITQPFTGFKNETISIINSSDHKLRIYGWNTQMGGTELDFENVIQYKSRNKINSIFQKDTINTSDSGYVYQYDHIYTLKTKDKTYYIVTYYGIFGTWSLSRGIQIFCVVDGKLNIKLNLIKTKTGFHNKLYYDSDYYSYANWKIEPRITYNSTSKTIKIPVTTETYKMTHKFINYKFNGNYFEKVK